VLLAAAAVLVVLTIPPRRLTLSAAVPDGSVAGIIHVHSNRSDGSIAPDRIAEAAARAGLKFVVFTDHGDATRAPDAPAYMSGVLCIDAVEISTTGGHYIALDMPRAPYPLGGEPQAVVEDVHRLGGFGIVAHPDSPKEQLRWKDYAVPFDAIEATNLDTAWRGWVQRALGSTVPARSRAAAGGRLLAAVFDYPFRPAETMASLTRPPQGEPEVDPNVGRVMMERRIVTTAGADAHAKLSYRSDPGDSMFSLPVPGYEQTFRTLSIRASLDESLTGDAARDSKALIRAIREGHLYTAVDGVATPPAFDFSATNSSGTAREGDRLRPAGPVTLRVRTNAPAGFTTTVWNGGTILSSDHHESTFAVTRPEETAAYWVSVQAPPGDRGVTWLRSNPIFVLRSEPTPDGRTIADAPLPHPIFDGATTNGWHVEHDSTSVGALDLPTGVAGSELRLRYGLSAGQTSGPFVALAYDVPQGIARNGRLRFTVRAQQPMRISVQLRTPGGNGSGGERWQRSVYVSTVDEVRTVVFRDMKPAGATATDAPPLENVRSILIVVDTTNTKPGSSGRLWIRTAALGD
jgi:hypothetical protein